MSPESPILRLQVLSWQAVEQENGFVLLKLQGEIPPSVQTLALNALYDLQLDNQVMPIALFQPPRLENGLFELQALSHLSGWQPFESLLAQGNSHLSLICTDSQPLCEFDPSQNQLFLSTDSYRLPAGGLIFALAKIWNAIQSSDTKTLALMHSVDGFAFRVKPAKFMLALDAQGAIGACPLLEDWQITNRLATTSGEVGTLEGSLGDLFTAWLKTQHTSGFPNHKPWQVWLSFANKKGQQQLLTFTHLQTVEDFRNKVLGSVENL